jgi:phosphatidate cytidylyltransferase
LSNFLRRTLTGFWIVVFIIGGFLLHPVSFAVTGLIILTGTQYEYYRIIGKTGIRPQMITGLAVSVTAYVLATLAAAGILATQWLLLVLPLLSLVFITGLYRKEDRPFDSIAHTLLPLVYITLPLSLIPFAGFGHSGLKPILPAAGIIFSPGIIIGFFLLLWINDTGAYLAGVTLGKHRLMERISPKKSWEGFAGGALLALAAAWFMPGWLGITDRKGWLLISIIITVTGTYGDLSESMLKRSLGLKDSGNIMPGHGGFLDRFDSTLMSFPLVYLFIVLFG